MPTKDNALPWPIRRLIDPQHASSKPASPDHLRKIACRREAFLRNIPLYPSVKHLESPRRKSQPPKRSINLQAYGPSTPTSTVSLRRASVDAPTISDCASSRSSMDNYTFGVAPTCLEDCTPRELPIADWQVDLIEQMHRPVPTSMWVPPSHQASTTGALLPAEERLLARLQGMMTNRALPASGAQAARRALDVHGATLDFSESDDDA